jgi:hypothetical protein
MVRIMHPTEAGCEIVVVRFWKPKEAQGPLVAFRSVATQFWCVERMNVGFAALNK